MNNYKKPRINQRVYIIIKEFSLPCVIEAKVGYIGQNSFILEGYTNYRVNWREFYYDDYNSCWFSTLKEAKEYLTTENSNLKIKKVFDGQWNCEE
jgi:hypothetical protein